MTLCRFFTFGRFGPHTMCSYRELQRSVSNSSERIEAMIITIVPVVSLFLRCDWMPSHLLFWRQKGSGYGNPEIFFWVMVENERIKVLSRWLVRRRWRGDHDRHLEHDLIPLQVPELNYNIFNSTLWYETFLMLDVLLLPTILLSSY